MGSKYNNYALAQLLDAIVREMMKCSNPIPTTSGALLSCGKCKDCKNG